METDNTRFIDTIKCFCGHYYKKIKEDKEVEYCYEKVLYFPCRSELGIYNGKIDSKTNCLARDSQFVFLIDKYRIYKDIIMQELKEI